MKPTKITLFFLIFCLALTLAVHAEEPATSGSCGEAATWSFNEATNTLTISGTGAIVLPEPGQPTWGQFYSKIQRLVFSEGITHVPENAFYDFVKIKDITFLGDMPTFGDNCFRSLYCSVFYPKDNSTWSGTFPTNTGANEIYFQPFGKESTHCGLNATWRYDEATKTLTIGGSGAMFEYFDETRQPWYDFREEVEYILVEKGITHIGRNVFSNMSGLKSLRCLGDMPSFSYDFAVNVKIPGYYPDGNPTWDFSQPMIGSQGGGITWNYYIGTSGTCGGNTTWEFDPQTGTLTIGGTGKMAAYEQWENPWRHHNDKITKVIVKGTVDHIGDCAFFRLFKVTQIIIEEGVTSIGRNALQNTLISEIDLPDSVTKMGMVVLGSSHNLTTLTLPQNLKTLGENSFVDCPNLKSIYFGPNLTTLEESALSMLQGTSVYFTGDAPAFAEDTFRMSNATVYFPKDNPTWTEDLFRQYDANSLQWIPYDPENPDDTEPPVITDQDVYGEGWYFSPTRKLLIIFPECDQASQMDHIRGYASYAEEVIFEVGTTYVQAGLFAGMTNLQNIILLEELQTIEEEAFCGCSGLISITFPENLQFIGSNAFADCAGLFSLYFNTIPAPTIADTAFSGVTAEIYVPAGDPTWDALARRDFGGDMFWVDYEEIPTEPTESNPTAPSEPAPTDPPSAGSTEPPTSSDLLILTSPTISREILESAQLQNQTIQVPMGDCQWIIDPSTITGELPASIDLRVALHTTAIPKEQVKSAAAGRPSIQLSLAHDGEFGFSAALTVPVGKDYASQPVTLYYWTADQSLQKVATATVKENGTVELSFQHASDYLLVIGEEARYPWIPVIIGIVGSACLIPTLIFVARKKK